MNHLDINFCECSDPGCPACLGLCGKSAVMTLYRIDMQDLTGTDFCEDCANDAMESGLFSDISLSDDDIRGATLQDFMEGE